MRRCGRCVEERRFHGEYLCRRLHPFQLNWTERHELSVAYRTRAAGTHAYHCIEQFIGRFEPCRDNDGVAIGGIIQTLRPADVPDDRGPRLDTNPRSSKTSPGGARFTPETFGKPDDRDADDAVHHAAVFGDKPAEIVEIDVEQRDKLLRLKPVRHRREVFDIGEQRRHLANFPGAFEPIRLRDDLADDVGGEVLFEAAVDERFEPACLGKRRRSRNISGNQNGEYRSRRIDYDARPQKYYNRDGEPRQHETGEAHANENWASRPRDE